MEPPTLWPYWQLAQLLCVCQIFELALQTNIWRSIGILMVFLSFKAHLNSVASSSAAKMVNLGAICLQLLGGCQLAISRWQITICTLGVKYISFKPDYPLEKRRRRTAVNCTVSRIFFPVLICEPGAMEKQVIFLNNTFADRNVSLLWERWDSVLPITMTMKGLEASGRKRKRY